VVPWDLAAKSAIGALWGHLGQQTLTCGIPTVAREMAAIGVTLGMQSHPNIAVALQGAMTLVNAAAIWLRHHQIGRNPDEAARGAHGMSIEKWNDAAEKHAELRQRRERQSAALTAMHLASMAVKLGLSVYGATSNLPLLTSSVLGSEANNWTYAILRETGNASFRMVGHTGNAPHRVTPERGIASAFVYGLAQVASAYTSQRLIAKSVSASVSGSIVNEGSSLETPAAMLALIATVAGLRALPNVLVEAIDAAQLLHHELAPNGQHQHFEPALTGTDYARLLDHSPTRVGWNSIGGIMTQLSQLFSMSTPEARAALVNVGTGSLYGLTYFTVLLEYQAAFEVRADARRRAAFGAGAETAPVGGSQPSASQDFLPIQTTGPATTPPPTDSQVQLVGGIETSFRSVGSSSSSIISADSEEPGIPLRQLPPSQKPRSAHAADTSWYDSDPER